MAVALTGLFALLPPLARDREQIVRDLDLHVVLAQAGQFRTDYEPVIPLKTSIDGAHWKDATNLRVMAWRRYKRQVNDTAARAMFSRPRLSVDATRLT